MQFVVIFHLLSNGHPMNDYKSFKDLFQLLKVKFVSRKHWVDNFGWGMVEMIHGCSIGSHKSNIFCASFFAISVDEIREINNTQ